MTALVSSGLQVRGVVLSLDSRGDSSAVPVKNLG